MKGSEHFNEAAEGEARIILIENTSQQDELGISLLWWHSNMAQMAP